MKAKQLTAIVTSLLLLLSACAPTEADLLEGIFDTSVPSAQSAATNAPPILAAETEKPLGDPPPIGAGTVTLDFVKGNVDLRAESPELPALSSTPHELYAPLSEELVGNANFVQYFTIYNGEIYANRIIPQDLQTNADEYIQSNSWRESTKITVFDASDLSAPARVITLSHPDYAGGANHIYADADGIFVLLYCMPEDGAQSAQTMDMRACHFDFDGKLLDSFPFTCETDEMLLSIFRVDGVLYAQTENYERKMDFIHTQAEMSGIEHLLRGARSPYSGEQYRLCKITPENGLEFVLLPSDGNTSIISLAKYSDTQILVLESAIRANPNAPDPLRPDTASAVIAVSLYTPADGSYTPVSYAFVRYSDYMDERFVQYAAYDHDTGCLYICNPATRDVYAWRIHTDAPIAVVRQMGKDDSFPFLFAGGGLLIMARMKYAADVLTNIAPPEGKPLTPGTEGTVVFSKFPSSVKLKITTNALDGVAPSWMFSYVADYMKDSRITEIELSPLTLGPRTNDISEIAPVYYDTLALKLLAGDDDFDMMFLGGSGYRYNAGQIHAMVKDGYLLSMEALGLAHLYDDMLPGVKELCVADGKILLAPVGFTFDGLGVERAVYNEFGSRLNLVPEDIPRTLPAFTDYLLNRRAGFVSSGVALWEDYAAKNLMKWFENQYITAFMEHADNTQTMWDAMLDSLDRLYASELMAFELEDYPFFTNDVFVPYKGTVIDHARALLLPGHTMVNGFGATREFAADEKQGSFIPRPLLAEGAQHSISEGLFIAVNPRSKNLDGVKAYLETILSKDFRAYTEKDEYMSNASGSWVIYDDPQFAAYDRYEIYKELLANSTHSYFGTYTAERCILYSDYSAYREGRLSSADWKAKVDRELEFLRDE